MFPIENILACVFSLIALFAIIIAVYKAIIQFRDLMGLDRMNNRYREIFRDYDNEEGRPGPAETNF